MIALGDGRSGAGEAEARRRTGRNQAGEGRPVPSGTRGESTGMLQTGMSNHTPVPRRQFRLTSTEFVENIGRS